MGGVLAVNLKAFCEACGFPLLKTWSEAVDRVRKISGAPALETGRFEARPTGSGSMWLDCDGVYLGLLLWKEGRWVYSGGPSDGIRKCGFADLWAVQERTRAFLDTLAPPQ